MQEILLIFSIFIYIDKNLTENVVHIGHLYNI